MAMSPDGETVVSAAGDETLRFWKCFQVDAAQEARQKLKAKHDMERRPSVLRQTIR